MNFYFVRSIESRYFSHVQNSRQPLAKVLRHFLTALVVIILKKWSASFADALHIRMLILYAFINEKSKLREKFGLSHEEACALMIKS